MPLYDQFGRPVQARKRPERRPLATAPLLDHWREYVATGLTPARLARIFREADSGDVRRQAELFDQIEEKDAHLVGERSKRVNAILDVGFDVTPASEDARDVRIAEFVEKHTVARPDWPDVLTALQDSVGKGYAGIEPIWDASAGMAVPVEYRFIEQVRFGFVGTDGLLQRHPRLITDDDPMGIDIPPWKLIWHTYGGKTGHPARTGIFRVTSWMYILKNYVLKDWAVFAEVYGMPLRLGKYDPGASQGDKDALIAAIQSLGSDAAGVISKSTEIEFVEASKTTSSGELYENLASFANREISKAWLGQTLSAEVGDTGSYAAAKTHNEVRLDLLLADARAAAATVRNQIFRPLVGFNFGWDAPLPDCRPAFEEGEDLGIKGEWVTKLLDRGVVMPVAWLRREFGIPDPEGDEETIGGRTPAPDGPPVAARMVTAKDSPAPESEGALIEDAADETAGPMSDMVEPIRELVESADSLEAIRDGLFDLYPDLPAADFGALLQRAMIAAHLAGREEIDADDRG